MADNSLYQTTAVQFQDPLRIRPPGGSKHNAAKAAAWIAKHAKKKTKRKGKAR